MKGLCFRKLALAMLGGLAVASAVHAAGAITEIQDNAYDWVNDATYIDQVLTYHADDATGFNILTVTEDGVPLPGYTWNVDLTLSSTFQDYAVSLPTPPRAYFAGGSMNLTFDYSANGGVTWTNHVLSGVITEGSLEITSHSPTLSTMTGIFNFDTAQGSVNLPFGDIWPATGLSTAVALTFAIGADLGPLTEHPELWLQDLNPAQDVVFDTQFSFFPDERPIPEPASLLLLGLGSLILVRRR